MTVIESVRVKKFPHHLFAISPIILGVDGFYKMYLGRISSFGSLSNKKMVSAYNRRYCKNKMVCDMCVIIHLPLVTFSEFGTKMTSQTHIWKFEILEISQWISMVMFSLYIVQKSVPSEKLFQT